MDELTGIERLLIDSAVQVAEHDHIEQVVLGHPSQTWLDALPERVRVVTSPRRPGEIARRPPRPNGAHRFDYVHSFGAPLPATPAALRSYTVHDWGPFTDSAMTRGARVTWITAVLRGLRATDQLHVYAQTIIDDCPAFIRPLVARRPAMIGLPAAPTLILDSVEHPARDPRLVLTIGTDFPRKRFAELSEAVRASSDLRLTLAGGGTEQRTEEPRVFGVGRVTDEQLADLYAGAGVFALISSYEGFGLPVMEAWLAGCRVVITDAIASRLPPEITADATIVSLDASPAELTRALEAAAAKPLVTEPRRLTERGVLVQQIVTRSKS